MEIKENGFIFSDDRNLVDVKAVHQYLSISSYWAKDIPFDLVRNMILSVYKNKNYSNQRIMKDALEKLLNQQWLHQDVLEEFENEN